MATSTSPAGSAQATSTKQWTTRHGQEEGGGSDKKRATDRGHASPCASNGRPCAGAGGSRIEETRRQGAGGKGVRSQGL